MGVVRKEDGRVVFERQGIGEVRATEAGRMSVEFGNLRSGMDPSPLFKGLPDDMCQAHHYGFVIRGTTRWKTKGEDVVIRAGEVFHIGPGHIPVIEDGGCEWVLITSTVEYQATAEAILRNAAEAGVDAEQHHLSHE